MEAKGKLGGAFVGICRPCHHLDQPTPLPQQVRRQRNRKRFTKWSVPNGTRPPTNGNTHKTESLRDWKLCKQDRETKSSI